MFPRLGVPEPHRTLPIPADQCLAIRAEPYASGTLRSPGEYTLQFPRLGVPQPHCLVVPVSSGDKRPAIRTERDTTHHLCMTGERRLMFTRHRIPHPHRFVQTPTENRLSIPAEHHASDVSRMPTEQGNISIRLRIIEPDTDGTENSKPSPVRRILSRG